MQHIWEHPSKLFTKRILCGKCRKVYASLRVTIEGEKHIIDLLMLLLKKFWKKAIRDVISQKFYHR